MKKMFVLYNPLSCGETGFEKAKALDNIMGEDKLIYRDLTKMISLKKFFEAIDEETDVILSGGDGTLSCFIDAVYNLDIKNNIYYYAAGTGNDFLIDLGGKLGCKPILINEYMKNLPVVTVKGKSYHFINGIGYGIDGYASEIGDIIKAKGKKVNYAKVVIQGIAYAFKPKNARVTVDGVTKEYNNVWFCPVMKGKSYGGGFLMAPKQDRRGDTVTSVCVHTAGRLKLLALLPSALKGEHIKYTKYVEVIEGREIKVEFNEPTALQIDGETILNVTEYEVKCPAEKIRAVI